MKGRNLKEAVKLRGLMQKHDIIFEGVVLSSDWPIEHKETFRTICDVDRIFYEELMSDPGYDNHEKKAWKDRIADIRSCAYSRRKQLDNEATWRIDLEHKVMARLDSKINCSKCQTTVWALELQRLPPNPSEAEIRGIEARRNMECKCQRTEGLADEDEPATRKLFASKSETAVGSLPHDDVKDKTAQRQRPDRVHGLLTTDSLSRLISRWDHLTHSPFAQEGLIYPFLVVEAKQERDNPGFESIEAQTAFPIRTMLKIQAQLLGLGKRAFHPLVWFLAHVGDSWRVYACTIETKSKMRFRIFELWEGTILSHDKVLRLLLIIDRICDWALEFRKNVYHCLRSDLDQAPRDLTRALSVLSTQEPTYEHVDANIDAQGQPNDQELDNSDCSSRGSAAENDIEMFDTSLQEADRGRNGSPPPSSPEFDQDLLTDVAPAAPVQLIWQDFSQVELMFHRVDLPERPESLHELFLNIHPSRNVQVAAEDFLACFSPPLILHVTAGGIDAVENAWTATPARSRSETGEDEPHCALIYLKTFFRKPDFHPVRQLTCVTMKKSAYDAYRSAINNTGPVAANEPHKCECLVEAVKLLRMIPKMDTASLAAIEMKAALLFTIGENSERSHFQWQKISSAQPDSNVQFQRAMDMCDTLIELQSFWERRFLSTFSVVKEVLPGPTLPSSLRAPENWWSFFRQKQIVFIVSEAESIVYAMRSSPRWFLNAQRVTEGNDRVMEDVASRMLLCLRLVAGRWNMEVRDIRDLTTPVKAALKTEAYASGDYRLVRMLMD